MAPITAARAAARAETLRDRLLVQLLGRRILAAGVACVLLAAAVVEVHVAAYFVLFDHFGAKWTPLVLAGGDLVLALLVVTLAWRAGRIGRQLAEATELRDRALGDAGRSLTLLAALVPVLRLLRGRGSTGAALATVLTLLFRAR